MSPEEQAEFQRRRRGRNIALALVLAGFVVLFYAITVAKIAG
jgi:ferric-dicitrate binding protein FerR (iron transport regulator)